eukprot:tig00000139_g8323.t1
MVATPPRTPRRGGCGERAAVVSRQASRPPPSSSSPPPPRRRRAGGRGALRLMEVAALVLAAALKAGNERLCAGRPPAPAPAPPPRLRARLLHRHRVDSPLLAPHRHPARFSLVALLGLPRPARSSLAGLTGGRDRSRAASFTSLFRAHAAGA